MARPPTFAVNPQEKSMLFQLLPQELRDGIYSYVFFSTRLTYGRREVNRVDRRGIKPAPNALAVLQTCRRARKEVGDTWIGQVLFSFQDPETMLDKLTALPPGILPKMRHLRVFGCTLALSYEEGDVYYRLVSALGLLQGLYLDTLTVLGLRNKEISYDTLNGLIKESCGWKELRYISHTSEVLGFARLEQFHFADEVEKHRYWRKPQPAHWQSVLEGRDGALSRPSIAIYRSTVADCPGSVINPNTRARFEQEVPEDPAAQEAFGTTEDEGLVADGERSKEMMVIVKRGSSVDYEQKKDSPFTASDLRRDMPGKTWKQIRRKCFGRIFADEEEVEVDTYVDVDEYEWPPSHFMIK